MSFLHFKTKNIRIFLIQTISLGKMKCTLLLLKLDLKKIEKNLHKKCLSICVKIIFLYVKLFMFVCILYTLVDLSVYMINVILHCYCSSFLLLIYYSYACACIHISITYIYTRFICRSSYILSFSARM